MLITKTNPVALDVAIQNAQTVIYDRLKTTWGIANDNDYDCYGRVSRNKRDNQFIAEVMINSAGDYKEVYWDDTKSAISWFGTGSTISFDTKNKVPVHLVYFVNLKKLKPAITHRADEEVRRDVQKHFGNVTHGLTFENIELWTENVLKEYPGSRRDSRLAVVDIHPLHCFRLNFTLIYSNNICLI